MTRLHLIYIMYERARARIESKNMQDANGRDLYMTVLANFALNFIREDSNLLYEAGFFTKGSGDLLEQAYAQTLTDLRPQIVNLAELVPCDVASTIGNKYGDIYEQQYDTAVNSRLNTGKVPELYHTHIKPVMNMVQLPKL